MDNVTHNILNLTPTLLKLDNDVTLTRFRHNSEMTLTQLTHFDITLTEPCLTFYDPDRTQIRIRHDPELTGTGCSGYSIIVNDKEIPKFKRTPVLINGTPRFNWLRYGMYYLK